VKNTNTLARPKPAPRRALEAFEARREEILDAATELFARYGYSDAVTGALAERLGVGKGTLYRHFPSKRELFLAAADRVMRRARETIEASTVGVDDAIEQIVVSIRAFLTFFAAHPEFVELLIQERALFKDRTESTYIQHRDRNVVRWREHYRSLIAAGRLRDIPVERITGVIGDLLYGTIFTNYFTGPRQTPEAQTQDILDLVFEGILSQSERRRRAASPPVDHSPR
jgi:AcrR family transcriptional regulator